MDNELLKRIDLGIKQGVAKALLKHKLEGYPIYTMKDGRVIKIPPEEIQVDESFLKD